MKKSIHTARYQVFTDRLRELRSKAGLTQRQLAEKLEVPHGTVARIELGERRLDVLEYLQVLDALGVKPKAELRRLVDLLS